MKTQLLCTFATKDILEDILEQIESVYEIVFDKIYVLQNEDNVDELMCTYNVDATNAVDYNKVPGTISLHRKKLTNSLYTINALNELIRTVNNGVLDTTFQVEWDNYRNCILTTAEDGLKRIDTEVDEIIHIKVKR